MDNVLGQFFSNYKGDKSLPMDLYIKPDKASNKGVMQAIGNLFRSTIIAEVSNKTISDYKRIFGAEPANIQIRDLLVNLAFSKEFGDKYTHIVGVGEGYKESIIDLQNQNINDLVRNRYSKASWYLGHSYPRYAKRNLWRFQSVKFNNLVNYKTSRNETFGGKAQKLLNLNFNELIDFMSGNKSLATTKMALEDRLKWLYNFKVSDLY